MSAPRPGFIAARGPAHRCGYVVSGAQPGGAP